MALPQRLDGLRGEEALVGKTFGVEKLLGPRPQRYAEAHLGPLSQLRWHVALEELTQDPLALAGADLHVERQPPRQLGHRRGGEGPPRLEAGRHGGPGPL